MALTRVGTTKKDRSAVFYEVPRDRPKAVRWLHWLVIVSAVYAVVSVFTIYLDIEPILTVVWEIEESFLADPIPGEEELRDMARIASGLAAIAFLTLAFLLLYIPIRYGMLARRIKHGSPETYRAIRFIARVQIGMEAARLFFLMIVSADLESIHIELLPTFTLLLAPAILVLLRKESVRAFFSWYETCVENDRGAAGVSPVGAAADPAHAGNPTSRPVAGKRSVERKGPRHRTCRLKM